MGVFPPLWVSTQRQSIVHNFFFFPYFLPFSSIRHLASWLMQLQEYRDCGVGSEGILCHYLRLILSNREYFTEWLCELLPHISDLSSIRERLEQQQPSPFPAPKGKRTIKGAVKQQSKGVFAAQGWSNKTELCPRLNKIVRKTQSTIKDMFFNKEKLFMTFIWHFIKF